jgi:hypothetical protein
MSGTNRLSHAYDGVIFSRKICPTIIDALAYLHDHRLWHNDHSQTPRLTHHTPRNTLQAQPTQPRLRVLNLRNLIHMLQAHRAHRSLDRISHRWTTRTRLSLLPIMIIHRAWYISGASYLAFRRQHACCAEQ